MFYAETYPRTQINNDIKGIEGKHKTQFSTHFTYSSVSIIRKI